MGSNVRFVDYSTSEVVCSSRGIFDYMESYMNTTPSFTIGRSEFLQMWEELVEDILNHHKDAEELEWSYDCFVDLADVIVRKTGAYSADVGLLDAFDFLIW